MESNLVRHAREELQRAGLLDSDSDYGGALGRDVMEMVKRFSDDGHSGLSAAAAISLFEKLARFEPITPLTGEDDEWEHVARHLYQNKRYPYVFREGGEAYDIEGRIFRHPDGACFTSRESRVPVTFPYTPTREYVDVPEETEE